MIVAACDGPFRPGKTGSTLVALVALFSLVLIRDPDPRGTQRRKPYHSSTIRNGHRMDALPAQARSVSTADAANRRFHRPGKPSPSFEARQQALSIGSTKELETLLASVAVIPAFGVLLFTTAQDKTRTLGGG